MSKEFMEEAMVVYAREIKDTEKKFNESFHKAVNAMWRGDTKNYKKYTEIADSMKNKMQELNYELDVIKANYAAI